MPTNPWLALLLACLVSGCAGMPNLLRAPSPRTCAKVCPDGKTAAYVAAKCESDPCSGHAAAPPRRDPSARPGPSS